MSKEKQLDLPPPSMLKAFKRAPESVANRRLVYPNLDTSANDYRAKENRYLQEFWKTEDETLEEEDRARAAAIGYLVLSAQRLHQVGDAPTKRLIAARMTEASAELYGAPEIEELRLVAAGERANFESMVDDPGVDQNLLETVLQVYRRLDTGVEAGTPIELRFNLAAKAWATVIRHRHRAALEVLEQAAVLKTRFSPEETRLIFNRALAVDKSTHDLYRDTGIGISDGSAMNYSEAKNQITIGINAAYYGANRLVPLYVHELYGHGQRSLRGKQSNIPLIRAGLPNNIAVEEGVCIFNEFAMTGKVPVKILDHYINIGLAMDIDGQGQMGRQSIHQLATARDIVRAQAAGDTPSYETAATKAWSSVNRVFRGNEGDDIAISANTKDIVYYSGFLKIGPFIKTSLEKGILPEDVYDYVMQAKFNPTSQKHLTLIGSL